MIRLGAPLLTGCYSEEQTRGDTDFSMLSHVAMSVIPHHADSICSIQNNVGKSVATTGRLQTIGSYFFHDFPIPDTYTCMSKYMHMSDIEV